jgi:tetratricopeptide (TPR) repeat protein
MILGVLGFPADLERYVLTHILKSASFLLVLSCAALLPGRLQAQGNGSGMVVSTPLSGGLIRSIAIVDLDLYIKGPNGTPLEGTAVVTLTKLSGEFYKQGTAKDGYVRINEAAQGEYNVLVVAPGFARVMKQIDAYAPGETLMKFTVQVQPAPEGEDAVTDKEFAALAPKAQKALSKAIESLRNNKLPDARGQLDTAYRVAPSSAEVNYLYGVYSLQMNNRVQAESYWTKALELHPKHFRALISLSQALLEDNKLPEALVYLDRAVKAEPSSWRAHAIYAEAYLRHGSPDEAIQQAERALQLGRGEAVVVKRYLAAALAKRGEKDKAIDVLQKYVEERPGDMAAKKQLENLQSFTVQNAPGAADAEMVQPGALADATALPLPSAWLPPDIDEKVPAVENGSVCALDDVVQKAGQRIEEFVTNVDRFVATESVSHETINRSGLVSAPETRKFDYMVSIQEVRKGFFNVEEFRTVGNTFGEFPGGVDTNGLPAMVLIFHPYNVGSFDLTCEGLARWNGGLAWQVHFRQRPDKPNTMRKYRLGAMGRSVPVSLKGRAWIAADTYQVVRLETQMLAPVPEIHLAADSTVIEYGPVHFRERNMDMWLPQSADVYSDWRGRRFHRRHSFSKYLLSSVDDQQHISAPKTAEDTTPKAAPEAVRPNP